MYEGRHEVGYLQKLRAGALNRFRKELRGQKVTKVVADGVGVGQRVRGRSRGQWLG